jgi:hypothetical protein
VSCATAAAPCTVRCYGYYGCVWPEQPMASLRGKSGKSSDTATATSCAGVPARVCIATTTSPQPFSLRPPHSNTLTSRLAVAGGSAAGPTEAPHGRSSPRRMAHRMARYTPPLPAVCARMV